MSRSLGGNHEDIVVFRWLHLVEMDGEPVGEGEGCSLFQVRGHRFAVNVALNMVRHEEHDHVGVFYRLTDGIDRKSVLFCNGLRPASIVKPHDHRYAAVPEILCMGMSLASVPENGHCFALENLHVRILVVQYCCHFFQLLRVVGL